MSGKKRALVGMDARLEARLAALDAHLGSVQADYKLVDERIAALRAEEELRARTTHAARQQAVQEAMAGAQRRFRTLEARTAAALADQESRHIRRSQRLEADLHQTSTTLASLAYEMDQHRLAAQDVWRCAQETIEAAKTLEESLCAYYPARLWKSAQPRIHAWLDESEASLYRGQNEAALLSAQQAYLDLQGLRLNMEAHFQRQQQLRMSTVQRLHEVISMAENNAGVQAIDLEGRLLDTWIDVNQWSNGMLGRVHTRASALLAQVTSPSSKLDGLDWRELLEEQIPRLEQAICEAVRRARQTVIASQLRYNIAGRVVAALTEQGYTLAQDGWQEQSDHGYLAALCDYSGNQVTVSVSAPPTSSENAPGQAYQLEIDYQSQEALSEHILHRSVNEIYTSLREAGLNVAALPVPVTQYPRLGALPANPLEPAHRQPAHSRLLS